MKKKEATAINDEVNESLAFQRGLGFPGFCRSLPLGAPSVSKEKVPSSQCSAHLPVARAVGNRLGHLFSNFLCIQVSSFYPSTLIFGGNLSVAGILIL